MLFESTEDAPLNNILTWAQKMELWLVYTLFLRMTRVPIDMCHLPASNGLRDGGVPLIKTELLGGWLSTRIWLMLDWKTVRIFAYSSTREKPNKRSGKRLKTESKTGERR